MLFNSFEFIFFFLPITLGVFFCLSQKKKYVRQQIPILWLVAASLFFYGWWNPKNLPLILISIVVNYGLGYFLSNTFKDKITKKATLFLGVAFNLALIGYFKYANFFL